MKKIILNEKRRTFIASAVKAIDSEARTIRAYASTNAWDRYGERFEADAFKGGMANYEKNPVVLFAHDYTQEPVAKMVSHEFDSKGLILTMKFADTEKAKQVFSLYEGGFMSAFSVGFRPLEVAFEERVKGSGEMGAVFKRAELLENSAVPVPANPEAVVIKGLGGKTQTISGELFQTFMESAVRGPEPDEPKPVDPPAAAPAQDPPASAPAPAQAPEAEPDPAEPEKSLKVALGALIKIAQMVKEKGKVADEGIRSLLVQANNLCRELVYGRGVEPLGGMEGDLSDQEIAALVKEYELLSETIQKDGRVTEKDRADFLALGQKIEKIIKGEKI